MKQHLHLMAKLYKMFRLSNNGKCYHHWNPDQFPWIPVVKDSFCGRPDHLQGGSQGLVWETAGLPSPTNFQITKLIEQIPVDLCTNLRQFSFFFDKLFWLYVSILSPEARFVKRLSQTTTADVRGMEAILPARHV